MHGIYTTRSAAATFLTSCRMIQCVFRAYLSGNEDVSARDAGVGDRRSYLGLVVVAPGSVHAPAADAEPLLNTGLMRRATNHSQRTERPYMVQQGTRETVNSSLTVSSVLFGNQDPLVMAPLLIIGINTPGAMAAGPMEGGGGRALVPSAAVNLANMTTHPPRILGAGAPRAD